jgi:hypothetical protein
MGIPVRGPAKPPVPPTAPIVRNKANLPRLGRRRCRLPGPCSLAALGTSAPNKPNCPEASGEASILQESSYDELDAQKASAKQSQFRRAGPLGPDVQTKPIRPRPAEPSLGPIIQNEPNLAPGVQKWARRQAPGASAEGRLCKTNPISATRPIMRDKANSRRHPAGRGTGDEGRGGQSCKTKPIIEGVLSMKSQV